MCDHNYKCVDTRPLDGYRLRGYKCLICGDRYATVEVKVGGVESHSKLAASMGALVVKIVSLPTETRYLINNLLKLINNREVKL